MIQSTRQLAGSGPNRIRRSGTGSAPLLPFPSGLLVLVAVLAASPTLGQERGREAFEPVPWRGFLTHTYGDSDRDTLTAMQIGRDFWLMQPLEIRWGFELLAGRIGSSVGGGRGSAAGFDLNSRRVLWEALGNARGVDFAGLAIYGAAGWQYQSTGFPGGSRHNFRLAAGLEYWIALGDGPDAFAFGLRCNYFHLSSANLGDGRNEGLDAIQVGLGLSRGF